MDVVWRRGSASVKEVTGDLNEQGELAYTTVMTIMSRLLAKGLLERQPSGRAYVYSPRLDRAAYDTARARKQAKDLIEQFGDLAVAQIAKELQDVDPARARRLGELLRRRPSG